MGQSVTAPSVCSSSAIICDSAEVDAGFPAGKDADVPESHQGQMYVALETLLSPGAKPRCLCAIPQVGRLPGQP